MRKQIKTQRKNNMAVSFLNFFSSHISWFIFQGRPIPRTAQWASVRKSSRRNPPYLATGTDGVTQQGKESKGEEHSKEWNTPSLLILLWDKQPGHGAELLRWRKQWWPYRHLKIWEKFFFLMTGANNRGHFCLENMSKCLLLFSFFFFLSMSCPDANPVVSV